MNLLSDKNQIVNVSSRHVAGEPKALGVQWLYSAVFEPKSRIIVGVVEALHENLPACENITDKVYVWSVDENGVITTKSDIGIDNDNTDFARQRGPRAVALINIDKEPKLIVCISIGVRTRDVEDETVTQPELWEADFLAGGRELKRQLDTSRIVTPDVSFFELSTWENRLYVRATNKQISPTKSSIHVYVDLVYKCKLTTPWGDEEDRLENVAFSDKYVFAHFHGSTYTSICAFTWSPDSFTIGDMVFGPEVGCQSGSHFLLSSSLVVTNMYSRELLKQRRILFGIYNVEDKSCKQIELPWYLGNFRTMIQVNGRLWLVLNDHGKVYELSCN